MLFLPVMNELENIYLDFNPLLIKKYINKVYTVIGRLNSGIMCMN